VAQAQRYIADGYDWVVDLDLEKFLDRVNHDKLTGRVTKRVEECRLRRLSWMKRSSTVGMPCSFHESAASRRGVNEGIRPTRLTSPISPRRRHVGSVF
jgi:retron-type reverse transcriptase